jgi:hypothetical protein
MKNLFFVTASILWACSTTFVFADGSPQATARANTACRPAMNPCTRMHELNLRLQNEWRMTTLNLEKGKISAQKAEQLRSTLKSILEREAHYFSNNGLSDLTTDQQNQLNRMLIRISNS